MRVRPIAALAVLALSACGPVEYISHITFQAQRAVDQARNANAEQLAPYEWTLAVEHLYKARELGGYARFQEAVAYGKTAVQYGRQAESIALGKDPNNAVPVPPKPEHPKEMQGE
jgi:hypothetical protein